MPFLGSQPADQYQSLAKQTITGDGSTAYTLNRSVTNAYDMEVFINNVRQEPDTSYSASGNTITFTAAITASDSCYLIYQGQSVGSINPPANSVGTSQVANNSITTAHMHTGFTLPAQSSALDITTTTHANASVFKSTGHTQVMLQDTDASANDQFWGLQNSGGEFNILTCNDDRASGFVTPMTITQSGYVKKPNQPAFRVGKTSAQQDSGGTHPILTFDVIDYNIGNHFDLSTDKFTAPTAGRYLFGWTLGLYRHSSAWMGVYSYKNNVFLDYSQSFAYSTASWQNFDASILVNLAVNDTFHIALQNGSNAAADNSGCFWGFLVG